MKLVLLDKAKEVLTNLLSVPVKYCSCSNENCASKIMDSLIKKAILDTEKDAANHPKASSMLVGQIKFLEIMSKVQEDGRSCPASDRKKALLKITDDSWRYDYYAVTIGLRLGCITLSLNDVTALSSLPKNED